MKLKQIFQQYTYGNEEGNGYKLFDKYKEWFEKAMESKRLNNELKSLLLESIEEIDLVKYDFVLLIVQTFGMDFSENENHFELLFKMADKLTENYQKSTQNEKIPWLLHQLADICIHYYEELEKLSKKDQNLILNVIEKVGKVKYDKQTYGPQMYFAAYKTVGLFWYVDINNSRPVIKNTYLKHFDSRVIEEMEELIEYLKEENIIL